MTDIASTDLPDYTVHTERRRAPAPRPALRGGAALPRARPGGGADRDGGARPAARHDLRPGHPRLHAVLRGAAGRSLRRGHRPRGPRRSRASARSRTTRSTRRCRSPRAAPSGAPRARSSPMRAEIILREEVLDDPALVGGTQRVPLPRLRHRRPLSEGHDGGEGRSCRSPAPATPSGATGEITVALAPEMRDADPPGRAGRGASRRADGSVAARTATRRRTCSI